MAKSRRSWEFRRAVQQIEAAEKERQKLLTSMRKEDLWLRPRRKSSRSVALEFGMRLGGSRLLHFTILDPNPSASGRVDRLCAAASCGQTAVREYWGRRRSTDCSNAITYSRSLSSSSFQPHDADYHRLWGYRCGRSVRPGADQSGVGCWAILSRYHGRPLCDDGTRRPTPITLTHDRTGPNGGLPGFRSHSSCCLFSTGFPLPVRLVAAGGPSRPRDLGGHAARVGDRLITPPSRGSRSGFSRACSML